MKIIPFESLSEDLRKRVEPLKPGQRVVYELLTSATVDVLDEATQTKMTMVTTPASVYVPTFDRIRDGDKWVNIGYTLGDKMVVDSEGNESYVPNFGQIKFIKSDQGKFVLLADRTDHVDIYYYMELTNYNATSVNPSRMDPQGRQPMFKRIRPDEKAGNKLEKDRMVRRAKEAIDIASFTELIELSVRFRQPTSSEAEQDIMRELLYGIAEDKPEKIINSLSDEAFIIKTLIKEAEELKVIVWSSEENKWFWTETQHAICSGTPGINDPNESLLLFIQQSNDGEKVKNKIKADSKAISDKKNKKR